MDTKDSMWGSEERERGRGGGARQGGNGPGGPGGKDGQDGQRGLNGQRGQDGQETGCAPRLWCSVLTALFLQVARGANRGGASHQSHKHQAGYC